MGSAASTGSSKDTIPSESSAGKDAKVDRHAKEKSILDESPFDSTALFTAEGVDDKPVMSNNKLKKMAFGIQGYKEQQRDYDATMNHLEMNHINEVAWSEPKREDKAHSPTKVKSANGLGGSGSHSSSHHALTTPTKPGMISPSASSHSIVKPMGPPPPNYPPSIMHDPHAVLSSSALDVGNHSSSFTKGNNQPRGGPPAGMVVRPFPRGVNSDDEGDPNHADQHAMQKNAPRPQQMGHPTNPQMMNAQAHYQSNPQMMSGPMSAHMNPQMMNPPMNTHMNMVSPASSQKRPLSSGQGMLTTATPPYAQMGNNVPPGMMTTMQMHAMQMSSNPNTPNDSTKQMNVSNKGPPPRPMMMQPGPMNGYNGPIGGPVSGTMNGPLPTNGAMPIGGGIMPNMGPRGAAPLPVVKETSVVKRNKVGLPAHMQHAKPKTGDWLNKRYFVNNYILLDTLGVGSYGEVRLCKDRNNEILYAIKIISKDFLKKKKNGKSDETYFEDIKREIAIMKKLLHPNILRLFEVLDDPKVNKMYLLLEYMKRGDLINILKKRNESENNGSEFTPLTDFEVWNITRQVVAGIRYLHFQNVVHGDIKPQNLLLGEDGIVKIADFGISKMLSMSNQQIMEVGGTPAFMSPELCENRPSFSGQLADVWAIGATIFMLRFGHPPFVAKSIINLYHKICHDPLVFPGPIDPGLKNLLEGMLEKDPEKRFTIPQIIQHPWYRFPPPVTAPMSQAKAGDRRPSGDNNAGNLSNKAGTTQSNKTATAEKGGALSFQPPPNYDEEEANAMKCPIQIVNNDDVFMSIGVGGTIAATKKDKDVFASVVDDFDLDDEDDEEEVDDDDDAKPAAKPAANKFPKAKHLQSTPEEKKEDVAENENLMDTNWGADVFGMVEDDDDNDDEEVDDDDDDDDFDHDKTLSTGGKSGKSGSKSAKRNASSDSAESKSKGSSGKSHHEMTEEEELRRSKQFIRKIARKSTGNMLPPSSASSSASSMSSPSKQKVANGTLNIIAPLPQQSSTSSLCDDNVSFSITPSQRLGKLRKPSVTGLDDDDEPEELTSEEFQQMMDTLAQQPVGKHSYCAPAAETIPEEVDDFKNLHNIVVPLQNDKTNIGCAFHSEQGNRPSQEDRFVLLPSISNLKALDSFDLHASTREQLSTYTLACVFDGHNGWRTSQHLSQFIPPTLVTHEKFLDSKDMKNAIYDTFSMIDYQVCQLLMEEDDPSGATGVVVIVDGRRRVLTVAGVGDSLCILSRSGKAVEMNKMHRLDNSSEKERVKKSGGTVMNKRVNGILAVSRAFGDTQFKAIGNQVDMQATGSSILKTDPSASLVIAEPDIHSEIITPKTEFAIIASDGLWDVISPQGAVNFVRSKLAQHKDLARVTKELVREAITRGSVDNVTVLILTFNSTFANS